ncbi:hypothetical protein DBR17_02765 [Sphingomonas sp. HMWF008]|nr:hypothetical protein DBR17_02765 [Sphingomonas sp. HMWF008]
MFGKSIVTFVIFGGLSVATPASAQSTTAVEVASSASDWVPLKDEVGGILLIDVTVNGVPATALIDTGFPNIILNQRFAISRHLGSRPIGKAYSVGGFQAFGVTDHVALAIGKRNFPDGPMQVADFTSVEKALGHPIDIVIGATLIASTGIIVDYDRRRVELMAPHGKAYSSKVPMKFDRNEMRFTISVPVNGAEISPLLIDTGSSSSFTITKRAYNAISHNIKEATDIEIIGGGGPEIQTIFTLPQLRLGTANVPEISAQVENEGFLAQNSLAGSIGAELLSRFNFGINPIDQSLYLSNVRGSYTPSAKSTVGIQGDYKPDRIVISHIMSGSPAQAAGLRDGDEICSVNGEKVINGWAQSAMRNWGTRAPGLKYFISLCSGKTISLTSAQFY